MRIIFQYSYGLAIIVIPTWYLADSTIGGLKYVAAELEDGTAQVPPPNDSVAEWPVIGEQVHEIWSAAATNLEDTLNRFEPQLKSASQKAVGLAGSTVGTVFQFILSVIIAGVLLMSADNAEKRGIEPLARIVSYATAGLDPSLMGVGPIHASRKALDKAGWSVGDHDLVEANEAFAAQACAVNKDLGWDPAIVNVNGGAIALGHPLGCTGAKLCATLLANMQARGVQYGVESMCVGGGMGAAALFELCD